MSTGRGFAKESSSPAAGWNDEESSLNGDTRGDSSSFQPDSADDEESFVDSRSAGEGHNFQDSQEEGTTADGANEDRGMNIMMSDGQQPELLPSPSPLATGSHNEDDMLLNFLDDILPCPPPDEATVKKQGEVELEATPEMDAKIKEPCAGKDDTGNKNKEECRLKSPTVDSLMNPDTGNKGKGQSNLKSPVDGPKNPPAKKTSTRSEKSKKKDDESSSNSVLSRRQKKKLRKKNEKKRKIALEREYDRFKNWFQGAKEKVKIDQHGDKKTNIKDDLHEAISRAKDKELGTMKNCTEKRLHFMVNEKDLSWLVPGQEKYLVDFFVDCCLCTTGVRDGKRKREYSPKYCEVCLKATGMRHEYSHDCPYCHLCFYKDWRGACTLLSDCDCDKKPSADKRQLRSC